MADECVTDEAREALLDVAEGLDNEAAAKEQLVERRASEVPFFDWRQ